MLIDPDVIRQYFAKLGLEPEIADIYLALHLHGPQIISELSRTSRIERTRIYRLIDKLLASNLIEVENHHKRGIVKAAPITNLHILIKQKEQEVKTLYDELGLIEQLIARNSLSDPTTRVQLYYGNNGLHQMCWNQLNAKTELLLFMDQPLNSTLGKSFTISWTENANQKNLRFRIIKSPHFQEIIEHWLKRNNVTQKLVANYESRIIDPETFSITSNMTIWDNVVSYYTWKADNVFGIEIYNEGIAKIQRQLFNLVWVQAQPTSL